MQLLFFVEQKIEEGKITFKKPVKRKVDEEEKVGEEPKPLIQSTQASKKLKSNSELTKHSDVKAVKDNRLLSFAHEDEVDSE